MALKWFGDRIAAQVMEASTIGIDKTLADCVRFAKANHPWENQTGTAEGSIRIVQEAQPKGAAVAGQWGSTTVRYFIYLELGTSKMPAYPTLRPTGDAIYPRLRAYIAAAYAGLGRLR